MYMDSQSTLTTNMRSILVDWLVEVQENFELNHETLYLAVKLVDTYLSLQPIPKENLQLVGAASLFISCKFDVSLHEEQCTYCRFLISYRDITHRVTCRLEIVRLGIHKRIVDEEFLHVFQQIYLFLEWYLWLKFHNNGFLSII